MEMATPRVASVGEADHPGVVRLGQHGVAEDVPVVLVGDPGFVRETRRHRELPNGRPQLIARARTRQVVPVVVDECVLLGRALDGAPVHRTFVGHGPRRHIDDPLTVPVHLKPTRVRHLADDGGKHLPLGAHGEERVDPVRLDDRAHPLLRLGGEDLFRAHRRLTQRNLVQIDVHAALAGARELRRRARQPGAAQVLHANHQIGGEDLQAALDEHLLRERIADLDAGPLGVALVEGRAGENGHAADAVPPRLGPEQNHPVADPGSPGELDPVGAQDADAQRIDKRIADIRPIEVDLTADVRQAEAVSVPADAGHHARQHPGRVPRVGRPEPQRIHDRDRAGAHGQNVADDAADAGGRTLVRLDIGGMVMRFDLEGDRPSVADIDHAGVLAHADEQRFTRWRLFGDLAQMNL